MPCGAGAGNRHLAHEPGHQEGRVTTGGGQESRQHLHTQGTLFYLGRALGYHKGHLLREVPGQLQEVDPKEGRPGWEPPVSTEDQ